MKAPPEAPPHAPAPADSSLAVQATLPAAPVTRRARHPGTRIDRYEIIRLLGEGGMGTVFLARDLRLGRRVAIKLLQPHEPDQARRLLAEARATARCQHDNIVVIHEVGEHDGAPYLVLEHLDGKPLAALVDNGQRLPSTRAVEIMCAIVRALSCAHEAGIVHRDLKPDNVFVTDTGTIKVLDFGIAKVLRPDDLLGGGPSEDAAAGTLPYMAPEQWRMGGEIDHRTDLWACGILLHQMICGRHPLPASQLITTAALDQPMPSMADAAPPGVPRELIGVVDRCLRKARAERWPSAAELLAALAPFLPGRRAIELQADESPYAGLAAFQERDAGKFFGRSHEIAELVARLADRPLVAVVGASGVGKSSFVRAGVIPALKRSGEPWETLVVRPGRKPIEALAAVIQPMIATAANLADDVEEQRRLVETLRREPGHLGGVLRLRARREERRLLVFVDQLEELYTQGADPSDRAAFTACLAGVADDATSPLRVALSLRADFFDRVAEDRRFADELAKGLFFLRPPGREGLRDAIESPAELAGYRFEHPAIVDDMLDHLEATPGALPLLQFAAARLWDLRDRTRRLLTQESYAAMGGVAGALARHADRVVSDLGSRQAPLARMILLRLVTVERTRAIVPLDELHGLSRADGEVQGLIDRMVDARLLVVQGPEDDKGTTVEIVHESLVHGWPTLRRWLDEHQDDAALVEQLRTAARQWEAKGRDRGLLWRGDALAEYERWRRRHAARLTPSEAAFGAASLADAARSRRIRQGIAAAAIAVSAVFVAALWRASLTANRAKLAAEALLRDSYFEQGRLRVLEGDKLGALAPLATAYRMGSTGTATRLLLEQAARPTRARVRALAGHTDKLWDVAYSPDGKWLATTSTDHTARVWDAETGALRATLHHTDWVITVAWSPDSRLVASGGSDHTVRVWDVIAGREVVALPVGAVTWQVAFSPDGSTLLTASGSSAAKLWRIPSGAPAGELADHRKPMGATFCEDGACIVTWNAVRIAVWDAATLAPRASYRQGGEIRAAAVSRSHALLAIGTMTGELTLLRDDGTVIARRVAHDHAILDLAISPDESVVATASSDGTVRLWSATGEPRGTLAGHRANVSAVRFTPAGDRIVTASTDGTARLWTVSGILLGELIGHTNTILKASIRPDGARVATASWDKTAIVWDLVRAQESVPVLTPRGFAPRIAAFAPSGRWLAVAAEGGELAIADATTGAVGCTAPGTPAIAQLAWTGEDELAVRRRGAQAVELWDLRRCAAPKALPHPEPITVMSVRPGPRVATAAGNIVRVFRGGQLEATFTGYAGIIENVGVDGDNVFATTETPAELVVDAIGDPARRRTYRAGTKGFADVRFDRQHGRIVAASLDQFVYAWNATTGALEARLEGTGPLWGVRASPDGVLAIGVGGVSPTVWNRADGARIRQLEGHSDLVRDGAFLGDRLFLSLAWNRTAILWDVDSGRALIRFHEVDEIAVSEARRAVALVGATGVRIWTPHAPVPDLDALRPHAAP